MGWTSHICSVFVEFNNYLSWVVIINKLKLTNVSCSKKKQHHHSWRARNSPIIVLHFDHQKVGAYLIKSPFGWMKHFWFWAESPEPLPNTEKSETFHPESPRNISYFNIRKENHPKGCCALILFHFRGNQDWYKLSKWFCFNRKSLLGGKNNLDPKRFCENLDPYQICPHDKKITMLLHDDDDHWWRHDHHLALATLLSIVHALKASLSTLILTISATNIYKKKSDYMSTVLRSSSV